MYPEVKKLMDPIHKTARRYVYRAAELVLEEGENPVHAANRLHVSAYTDEVVRLVEIYSSDAYAEYECSVAG